MEWMLIDKGQYAAILSEEEIMAVAKMIGRTSAGDRLTFIENWTPKQNKIVTHMYDALHGFVCYSSINDRIIKGKWYSDYKQLSK